MANTTGARKVEFEWTEAWILLCALEEFRRDTEGADADCGVLISRILDAFGGGPRIPPPTMARVYHRRPRFDCERCGVNVAYHNVACIAAQINERA